MMKAHLLASFAFFGVLVFISGVSAQEVDGGGACTSTAKDARSACKFEVLDDYWISLGKCRNSSDPQEVKECIDEAEEESSDSNEECADQYEARLEVCELIGEAPFDPEIDPSNFVNPSDVGDSIDPNPYFPLVIGRSWTYEGEDEEIEVTVLNETKEILGVECFVVRDIAKEDGEVVEDTKDWYAQDLDGNVWYFGEISQEFEDGELVGVEGSWEAGVDGAKPGYIMKATPVVGETYRQEFALGDAEDMGTVLSLTGSATSPAASCAGDCLVTKDFTPIEPDANESKYYKQGVGLILEVDEETGDRVELVEYEQ